METTIGQYKRIVKFAARMKADHGVNIPIFIWGMHATGKTSATRQVADEIGYHCEVLNLANQSPEDLLGNPVTNHQTKRVEFYAPDWLYKGQDLQKRTIYFLDEVNRAPKYVIQSMFNFVNEGRLHNHNIGPDDIIIAAGNPNSAEFEVTDFNDTAWLSRFAHFILSPTSDRLSPT